MAINLFNFGPPLEAGLATIASLQVQVAKILANQTIIITQGTKLMSALDDLNAVVTEVQAAIQAAVDLIQSLHSGSGTADADVEAAVQRLHDAAAALGSAQPLP